MAEINQTLITKEPVRVNYDLSVERLVELCRLTTVPAGITSANFVSKQRGEANVLVELVRFHDLDESDYDDSTSLYHRINGMGFREATIHEKLAYGTVYPELQLEFPIVQLASKWNDNARMSVWVTSLRSVNSGRGLCLENYHAERFPSYCHFAIVRK